MSIIINNWRMDPSLNALIHCETGETRRLGEYHFILLETLAKNADVVLSRSYLCAEVWKNRIVGGNSLPTAIHALRVAIDDDGKQGNDSNLLIVFYVQIMPDDLVMQLHRF